MTDLVRSEILVPARPFIFAALGLGAIGLAMVDFRGTESAGVHLAPAAVSEPDVDAPANVAYETAQPARSDDLALVFTAGNATYMKLDTLDADTTWPQHGKAKLHAKDGIESAIAPIAPADVPDAYREWLGREVVVDGACKTKVTGFAIVSRLTGETSYADVEGDRWTATNVLDNGSAVLAAQLAGCKGTYARAADLPAVIAPREITNAPLAARARELLVASEPSRAAQAEYAEMGRNTSWWDDEDAHVDTKIVRHPTTGVTWVSVHGHVDHACGDAVVNVWGLFRVEADGSLTPTQLRKLDDLWSIDKLIDVDNDGELEVIGTNWIGLDTVVARGSGDEIERLALTFFGCPC